MNFKELANNLGLEEDEYMELIELFIETGMSDLEKLHSAIKEGNAGKASDAAHSLKGAASNLGLVEISETAKEIEEYARDDHLDKIAESTQAIKGKLDEITELVIFTARSA